MRLQVAPILGGRLVGLQALPGGANGCASRVPGDRGWPSAGGYDELWATGAWGRGPAEAFAAEVTEAADGPAVILRAGVDDGVQIERRITAWRAAASRSSRCGIRGDRRAPAGAPLLAVSRRVERPLQGKGNRRAIVRPLCPGASSALAPVPSPV